MLFSKLYELLRGIIKSGNNPFDVDYWTPVYFHPYVTYVEGEWISNAKKNLEGNYKTFIQNKVKDIGDINEFIGFMTAIKSKVMELGYIVPPNIYRDEPKVEYSWDNKVVVSLLGKNEEILFLGWADHALCIGTELMRDCLTNKVVSYSVNNSN